jgi:hypothetical protein
MASFSDWLVSDSNINTFTPNMRVHTAEAYARKLDVVNRGFSGYNSRWAIPVFEQVCTIFLCPHTLLILMPVFRRDGAA